MEHRARRPRRPGPSERAFRLRLADLPEREPLHQDPVREFFRQQLLNLLEVVQPTVGGRAVRVDGFSFLGCPDEVLALWPESPAPKRTRRCR